MMANKMGAAMGKVIVEAALAILIRGSTSE
jgi:hypothetical protein